MRPVAAGRALPLIDLYTALDNPAEVAKWRAERAKYPDAALPPREKK